MPSRVRSPTPANTDTPPCWEATRLIISVISTVLPTPAPPNRPILPPATYGVSRSTTLMPVSNMRADGSSASKVGAGRWMSHRSISSRPSRLGVERLAPHVPDVAEHLLADRAPGCRGRCCAPAAPRTRPSVGFMQIARTRPSPSCCATSASTVIVSPSRCTSNSSAELISGRAPARELDVDHGAGDTDDTAVLQFVFCHGHVRWSPV